MSEEPSYPEDASIGSAKAQGDPKDDAAEADPGKRKRVTVGVAAGIGSAAIVAALLYANRSRRGDKGSG